MSSATRWRNERFRRSGAWLGPLVPPPPTIPSVTGRPRDTEWNAGWTGVQTMTGQVLSQGGKARTSAPIDPTLMLTFTTGWLPVRRLEQLKRVIDM